MKVGTFFHVHLDILFTAVLLVSQFLLGAKRPKLAPPSFVNSTVDLSIQLGNVETRASPPPVAELCFLNATAWDMLIIHRYVARFRYMKVFLIVKIVFWRDKHAVRNISQFFCLLNAWATYFFERFQLIFVVTEHNILCETTGARISNSGPYWGFRSFVLRILCRLNLKSFLPNYYNSMVILCKINWKKKNNWNSASEHLLYINVM